MIGGTLITETDSDQFLECVAVGSGGHWVGTGVLIAPELVLTALHVSPSDKVYFGRSTRDIDASLIRSVSRDQSRCISNTNGFGLTILVLESPAPAACKAVRIADALRINAAQSFTAVGFGRTENFSPVETYGQKRLAILTKARWNDPSQLRVGGGGADTCVGDSGGPIYLNDQNGKTSLDEDGCRILAGIVEKPASNTGKCGDGTLCNRVDFYGDWISREIDQMEMNHESNS